MSQDHIKLSPNSPLIIGGGVAGLMAALHLAERGLTPLILEAHPDTLGGRLANTESVQIEHQGKTWHFAGEHGVHGIWSPYHNLKHTLKRHDIAPKFVPALEETWIFGRGQRIRKAAMGQAIRYSFVPAPFHYLHLFIRPHFLNILHLRDVAALFRVLGSLLSAMSIDPLAEHKSLTGFTLADFMDGWSPTLKSFFAGLARNALAHHPEHVPAAGFIAFLRFYTLLRRDTWIFDYLPEPGGTAVIEPLTEVAKSFGANIQLDSQVTNLDLVANDLWQITYRTKDQQKVLETNQVVLAVDSPTAEKLLKGSSSTTEKAQNLYFPEGIPTAIIRLWFAAQPKGISEAGLVSGDFMVDNFFWLHRLQTDYREWAQSTGGSAIEMHIYGPPELLAQPDASLLAQVIVDTYRAFPELRGSLIHSILQRNKATHTLFGIGPLGHHLTITSPWPNLFVCGDWVYDQSPTLYLERASTTGIKAANAVLQTQDLEPWPLMAHPEPEWLAGKMEVVLKWIRQKLSHRKS